MSSDLPATISTEKDLERSYDERFTKNPIRATDRYYHWIVTLLDMVPGANLLDVACGGGHFLKQAENQGLRSWGCDISSVALGLAYAQLKHPRLQQCSGESLPFPTDFFDSVTCLGSLEHFLSPAAGIREIVRVLKPQGTSIIVLPNQYPLYEILHTLRTGYGPGTDQDLERFACVNDWRDLLTTNGLKVNQVVKNKHFGSRFKNKLVNFITPLALANEFVYVCTGRGDGEA